MRLTIIKYIVKVNKEITGNFLERMSAGIYLKDLDTTTRECRIEKEGKFTFRIVLTQGVNRQIRRMCRTLGYEVRMIKRVRVVNLTLDGLKPGQYREVKGEALETLYRLTGFGQGNQKGENRNE